jgi:hypothetical protein
VFLIQKETLFEGEGKQEDRCVHVLHVRDLLLSSTLNLWYEADLDDIERQEYLQGGEVFHSN